jgi:hypothetical protein
MSVTALIGYTGFVGTNLLEQAAFTELYNSKNIEEMRGKDYDLVVCAGVSAVKWWANKHPEEDWAGIARLIDVIKAVRARRFVLISTIDVYPAPSGVDESTPLDGVPNHAYGTHRHRLERVIEQSFAKRHVIRLPGLFGSGLKKNVIFDLLNDNCLDAINPESSFQYYDLALLWNDVRKVLDEELELVNFATEPIATQTILSRFFPGKVVGQNRAGKAAYDMKSVHAPRWGGSAGYLYGGGVVLDGLARYLDRAGARA